MCSRSAAKVSTCESSATPFPSRYPRNCPRTTSFGSSGRIARNKRSFSVCMAFFLGLVAYGGIHRQQGNYLE